MAVTTAAECCEILGNAPNNGVNDQLELRWRHSEQRREAVLRDRVQQVEELQPVFRVILRMLSSFTIHDEFSTAAAIGCAGFVADDVAHRGKWLQ